MTQHSGATPAEPTAGEVVRDFLGRGVGNLLRYDPIVRRRRDPEGIHQMRVNVRHLRSEMRVAGPVIRADEHEALDRELKWLGGALGRLRDLDVLNDLFASGASGDVPTPPRVVTRLATQRTAEVARLNKALRSKRYRRLMESLSDAVVDPPLRASAAAPASRVLGPGLREVARDLAATVSDLGENPSPEALHLVRIKVKRCRYNCELAEVFFADAGPAARELETAQGVLGDLHDHVVARDYLLEVTRPREMFGGPPLDDETLATARWLDEGVARLLAAWPEPVAAAVTALAPILHISSSEAPDVPVK
ncbi:MAG: CHAD domain-containing protein [Acidimicrobiales bacterium]